MRFLRSALDSIADTAASLQRDIRNAMCAMGYHGKGRVVRDRTGHANFECPHCFVLWRG